MSGGEFPILSKMSNRVVVKHFEGDERFTFSFQLELQEKKIDKQFNLNRALAEETSAFLDRLANNVNKAAKSKVKKSEATSKNIGVKFLSKIPPTLTDAPKFIS